MSVPRSAFEMPTESDGQSKGFMFVTLANPTEAQQFQRALHDFKFDKRHTFRVVPFADVGNYEQLEETYVEPATEEWAPRVSSPAALARASTLRRLERSLSFSRPRSPSWLYRSTSAPGSPTPLDVISSSCTVVTMSRSPGTTRVELRKLPTSVQCVLLSRCRLLRRSKLTCRPPKQRWTESYTQWSPYGTLFATIHGPGVALWGGSSFERLNRFAHPEVKLIDFSPFERYLVTWSPRPIEASSDPRGPSPFTEEDEGNQVAVWDVMTGALLRTFPMVGEPNSEIAKRIVWPMFKWSPDEKYLGRVTPGQQISVYEVPSMGLLGKKSLKIDGVIDFEWSPLSDKEREAIEDEKAGRVKPADSKKAAVPVRENIIAFWTPEVQNQPARVTLMHLPSRTTIRSKNLFNVHDVSLSFRFLVKSSQ